MRYVLEVDKKIQKPVAEVLIYQLANKYRVVVDVKGVYSKKKYDNGYVLTVAKLVEFDVEDTDGQSDKLMEELKRMGTLWEVLDQ